MDLKGQRFQDDNEVKMAIMSWLDSQTLKFWQDGIAKCQERWLRCFNINA